MNRRAPLHQRCALPLSFLSYCMWLNAIFLFFSTHLPPDIVFSHPRHRKVMILPTLLFILSSFNPHLLFILFIISPASCDTNQFHHSWFPPKAKADLLYKHTPPPSSVYVYQIHVRRDLNCVAFRPHLTPVFLHFHNPLRQTFCSTLLPLWRKLWNNTPDLISQPPLCFSPSTMLPSLFIYRKDN